MSGEDFKLITAAEAERPYLPNQPFNPHRLRQVLCDRHLHFSNPADFNDPWDCRPWFDLSVLNVVGAVRHVIMTAAAAHDWSPALDFGAFASIVLLPGGALYPPADAASI